MAALAQTEGQLNKAVVQYLNYALPVDAVFMHVPNEGKRGWKAQADLKANGTLPGAPDLIIFWRRIATFIELKSKKGVLSDAQNALHPRLRDAGFQVFVCRSLDDVQDALKMSGITLRASSKYT